MSFDGIGAMIRPCPHEKSFALAESYMARAARQPVSYKRPGLVCEVPLASQPQTGWHMIHLSEGLPPGDYELLAERK